MLFEDERNAFIEANWLTPRKIKRLRLTITGIEGIKQIRYLTQEVTVENQEIIYKPFFKKEKSLKTELQYFINSILMLNDENQFLLERDAVKIRVCY